MSYSMMNDIGLVGFYIFFLGLILFLVFGQTTMRKLRKNNETKDSLGIEFVSGDNSMGVALMLSIPRSWARRLDKNNEHYGGGIMPNSDSLYKNTNKFDRFLARLYFWLMWAGLILFMPLAISLMIKG